MSRFQKLSHVVWFCQYHIVFVPKYRYKILKGDLGRYVYQSIYAHTERAGCEVIELNVQADHVHLLVKIPPKVSVSNLVGRVKGKTAIQAFQKFPSLRTKKYWGESFLVVGLLC
ncbi:transposase, IS200/IS605 family [Bathymodiolus platifrons methanotrophic gill symbiont]|nr:transposase, IS200/IS605 family [Bathymodiolus platifrons methanotrophic gill symbiont]